MEFESVGAEVLETFCKQGEWYDGICFWWWSWEALLLIFVFMSQNKTGLY